MKKLLFGIFSIVCLFVLIGCQEEPVVITPPVEPTIEDYKEELFNYLNEIIPTDVSEDVDLIDYYEYEDGSFAELEWVSSNGKTITSKGKYKQNLFDEEITLTSTINFLGANIDEATFNYEKSVNTKGYEDLDEYKAIIEANIPDFVYKDFALIYRDTTYREKNIFGAITYVSSRPDVITNDGLYVTKEAEDVEVEFQYEVSINGIIVNGSKMIVAEGQKFDYYTQEAINFLEDYFEENEVVFENLILPFTDDNERVTISWKSSDLTVLSDSGALLTYNPNMKVIMTATIECYERTVTWEKEFRTYNEDELIELVVNRIHKDTIQQYTMRTYSYSILNYGYLPFYTQDAALSDLVYSTTQNNTKYNYLSGSHNTNVKKLNIVSGILPWNATGRTLIDQTTTQFITVHDTGDAVNSADWWNSYESSGKDTRETSWHFTVGDTVIYQHAPLSEVAWHAGDGSAAYGLNDTGVKYAGPDPEISLGDDHYIYINGQKSNIPVPKVTSTSSSYYGKYADSISKSGLYTCLGENGNYYMASIHASTYWQNIGVIQACTNGGNRNSIGIETCINKGVDYNQVMRNTSSLIASLLVYYGLEPDRVLYHQSFSGKLCPQVMLENNLIDAFEEMVKTEYIIRKYLSDIAITYVSNNPDIMNNEGKILKEVATDTEISYSVTITVNGTTKTYEKTTIVKPL